MNLITEFAERKQATPAQNALAWENTKKPYLIPIPGTTKKERVKENFEAVNVELSTEERREIEEALSHMDIVGMGRIGFSGTVLFPVCMRSRRQTA